MCKMCKIRGAGIYHFLHFLQGVSRGCVLATADPDDPPGVRQSLQGEVDLAAVEA